VKGHVKVGPKARERYEHVEDRSRAKLWKVKGKLSSMANRSTGQNIVQGHHRHGKDR
jgi:hypothetical protein